MADLTNEQTAERLEAVRGYLAKIAEAFLLGQSATPLHVYGPAKDGDAAQVFFEAAEAAEVAASRLRKPLDLRWKGHLLYAGTIMLGTVMPRGDHWLCCQKDYGVFGKRKSFKEAKAAVEQYVTAQVTGGGR